MMKMTGVTHPLPNNLSGLPFLLFGQADHKRTIGIQQARSRLGLPSAIVLSYRDLLLGQSLEELLLTAAREQTEIPSHWRGKELLHLCMEHGALLRLDSPGGGFEVERLLIEYGAPDRQGIDETLYRYANRYDPYPLYRAAAAKLEPAEGVLHHPSQWFRGYCRLLAQLHREAAALLPAAVWFNAPQDIADMTDKRVAQQKLEQTGISIPARLQDMDSIHSYEELRAALFHQGMHRVFVKLACGSAASGVIAYQLNPVTGTEIATTTVGFESFIQRPPRFYNAGKLRRYTDPRTIATVMNWVLGHGAQVEQWVPKASVNGMAFDVRQLVLWGEAGHTVARASRTPITNLHLRTRRMTPSEAGLDLSALGKVRKAAIQALEAFPNSSLAGVDVLLQSGSLLPYIVDVNPFGDLLYDVSYDGLGTYEWEMQRLLQRHQLIEDVTAW
ncbi:STM4014 family protein [Paenibacillus sp. JX-17]|uniref:STM4014 family protein n=2 Tax=Paenibacillus lacisoli TaxID=3064525 RepID=A0ABT9C738_9BACL|nr:STM4014 family protein [Paenibacillus sp. JX-17]